MKLWVVQDSCFECGGQPVAVFDTEKDAESLCRAFPWLTWNDVETEELIPMYDTHGYEDWFNSRADRALRKRAAERDCD